MSDFVTLAELRELTVASVVPGAESRANILMSQAIALRVDAERKIAVALHDLEALTGLRVAKVEVESIGGPAIGQQAPIVRVRVEL